MHFGVHVVPILHYLLLRVSRRSCTLGWKDEAEFGVGRVLQNPSPSVHLGENAWDGGRGLGRLGA